MNCATETTGMADGATRSKSNKAHSLGMKQLYSKHAFPFVRIPLKGGVLDIVQSIAPQVKVKHVYLAPTELLATLSSWVNTGL